MTMIKAHFFIQTETIYIQQQNVAINPKQGESMVSTKTDKWTTGRKTITTNVEKVQKGETNRLVKKQATNIRKSKISNETTNN